MIKSKFFQKKRLHTEGGAFVGLLLLATACGDKKAVVEVRPVRQDITETVFASGTLAADNQYNLTAQTDGYLSAVNFDENDAVSVNQLLAVVDNQAVVANAAASKAQLAVSRFNLTDQAPALQQVVANMEAQKKKLEQDRVQAERYRQLYAANSVSKVEWENAQLAVQTGAANLKALEAQYALLKQNAEQQVIAQQALEAVNNTNQNFNQIRALAAGTVLKRYKQKGDYVRRGDVIAVIGQLQTLVARVQIDEKSMGRVRLGQTAQVRLNVLKDSLLTGQVVQILPAFDEATQSFIAKIKTDKPLTFSIVGTQLEANIMVGHKQNVLLIPRRLLQFGNKVMVKGKKEPVVVQTGIISTEWVEVLGGLSENDILEPIKH